MFIILSNKNRILDIKAHEERVSDNIKTYYNKQKNKWAVKVSGKVDHGLPTVETLGEGWICN